MAKSKAPSKATPKKTPKPRAKKSLAEIENFAPAAKVKVKEAADTNGCLYTGAALAKAIADGAYIPTLESLHPLQTEIGGHPLQEIIGEHPLQGIAS